MTEDEKKPPKHRLFDEDGNWNSLGNTIENEFSSLIRKWFNEKVSENINVRELKVVMDYSIDTAALYELIDWD